MQNRWEDIQAEVTARLHKEFMAKYQGNKLKFAKDAGCTEGALRHLFDNGGNLSLKLLFKLSDALEIEPADFIRGLKFAR